MLTAIVLVCALGTSSCDQQNTTDLIRVPGEFSSPLTCFLQAQAFLGESQLGRDLRPTDTVRVICTPVR